MDFINKHFRPVTEIVFSRGSTVATFRSDLNWSQWGFAYIIENDFKICDDPIEEGTVEVPLLKGKAIRTECYTIESKFLLQVMEYINESVESFKNPRAIKGTISNQIRLCKSDKLFNYAEWKQKMETKAKEKMRERMKDCLELSEESDDDTEGVNIVEIDENEMAERRKRMAQWEAETKEKFAKGILWEKVRK